MLSIIPIITYTCSYSSCINSFTIHFQVQNDYVKTQDYNISDIFNIIV